MNQPQPGLPNGITELVQIPDGELDGPVYIPKIYDGRNKTFFMFGYERYIQKEGLGEVDSVPTAGELAGNYSFPEAPAGTVIYPIYDPASTTRAAVACGRAPHSRGISFPTNRFSPVASKFLALNPWAQPNAAPSWTTTGPTNNLMQNVRKLSFYENYTWRLDHELTSKLGRSPPGRITRRLTCSLTMPLCTAS